MADAHDGEHVYGRDGLVDGVRPLYVLQPGAGYRSVVRCAGILASYCQEL